MEDRQSNREKLKALRENRADSIRRAKEQVKISNRLIKRIRTEINDRAMTIPQIADAIGEPSPSVMVYVAGLKKFGMVTEVAKDGDYFTYKMVKTD